MSTPACPSQPFCLVRCAILPRNCAASMLGALHHHRITRQHESGSRGYYTSDARLYLTFRPSPQRRRREKGAVGDGWVDVGDGWAMAAEAAARQSASGWRGAGRVGRGGGAAGAAEGGGAAARAGGGRSGGGEAASCGGARGGRGGRVEEGGRLSNRKVMVHRVLHFLVWRSSPPWAARRGAAQRMTRAEAGYRGSLILLGIMLGIQRIHAMHRLLLWAKPQVMEAD